ncbi:CBS domain-containing protein [Diaphorobacter aerolatus]|uniref:CBS domain-containing protein n=1 Tax=Diaphorobacter aerolatus TaxID=1288495 RepID=A0A7H0GMC8_9BURK|nr:CBS domain-containing protein [Diaphorobacter aerolatus]QNP49444.1 CBS domain-containing protein [Diaphorobacter aerolatus]
MTTVAEVLKSKPMAQVYSVQPAETILSALKLMADKGIGALMVLDGNGSIEGIFSERDYARKVVLMGRSSGDTPISEVMTRAVRFVHLENSTDECMAVMTANRIRHLPVVSDGAVVGLISIGDLVKNIMEHQKFLIEQMEQYITGNSVS